MLAIHWSPVKNTKRIKKGYKASAYIRSQLSSEANTYICSLSTDNRGGRPRTDLCYRILLYPTKGNVSGTSTYWITCSFTNVNRQVKQEDVKEPIAFLTPDSWRRTKQLEAIPRPQAPRKGSWWWKFTFKDAGTYLSDSPSYAKLLITFSTIARWNYRCH